MGLGDFFGALNNGSSYGAALAQGQADGLAQAIKRKNRIIREWEEATEAWKRRALRDEAVLEGEIYFRKGVVNKIRELAGIKKGDPHPLNDFLKSLSDDSLKIEKAKFEELLKKFDLD